MPGWADSMAEITQMEDKILARGMEEMVLFMKFR
jgi:hypothetical protein